MAQIPTIRRRTYFDPGNPLRVRPWTRRGGFPAHAHDFHELVLITRGAGVQVRAGGEDDLRPGDLLLLRPGDWHAYRHDGVLAGLDLGFDPALLAGELAWTADDPAIARLLRPPGGRGAERLRPPARLRAPVATAMRRLRALDVLGPEFRAERIGQLVVLLARLAGLLPAGMSAAFRLHPAVATATRLMDEDPAKPWTLAGLALRTRTRPDYLCRLFRRDLGLPPLAWLARRRVRAAQSLLMHDDLAVATVAARLGWADANLFARRFRRETGLSPSAWRRHFA